MPEIGRNSVVMYVSDQLIAGKLQLTQSGPYSENKFGMLSSIIRLVSRQRQYGNYVFRVFVHFHIARFRLRWISAVFHSNSLLNTSSSFPLVRRSFARGHQYILAFFTISNCAFSS